MPKRPPPKPREVRVEAVRRGDFVMLPTLDGSGTFVKDKVLEHGLYIRVGKNPNGIFAPARLLWEALDEVIDIEDKISGVGE